MNQLLQPFIAHARKKGLDIATIRLLLLSAGWREKDVMQALSAESLDLPVPTPPDRGGAREAFFHLLAFAALYIGAVSLIVLFFTYINEHFPDPALQGAMDPTQYFGTIHWSMAAVIATFPLFLWMSHLLLKEMRQLPEKAASPVRRWLTYLTLFVAAMALIGDVITLVFNLLQGELSVRFLLKVLVVFVFAGLTFSYYFLSLRARPEDTKPTPFHATFGVIASVIVLVAIVWGFVLTGSPMTERERRFDDRRLQDLQAISTEIPNIVYEGEPWSPQRKAKHPIPTTLADVQTQALYQQLLIADPQTGAPYEYSVKDGTHYALCAGFTTVRSQPYDIFWNHPAARTCFTFDVSLAQQGIGKGMTEPVKAPPPNPGA